MKRFPLFMSLFWLFAIAADAAPLRVAFVYVTPVGDAGWTYSHELARQKVAETYQGQVETQFFENVPEGREARKLFAELAEEYDMIFSTSWGYMVSAQRVAQAFPEVKFEHVNGTRHSGNLSSFATRTYEARYLSGMVAAAMSKTGKLGYVAGHGVAEVIRGLNAFTLGAQAINPDIKVAVKWTGAWYKPQVTRTLSHELINEGADVLAQHVDSPVPVKVAQERGVYAIGYHTDMSEFGKDCHLGSVIHDWSGIYTERVKAAIDQKWQSENLWSGMDKQGSQLVSLSSAIPSSVVEKIEVAKQNLAEGKLAIFKGPIKNYRGRTQLKEGKALSDDELQRMNWYVAGVTGKLKTY